MDDYMNFPNLVTSLLKNIGEDPERLGLRDTPARVTKAWHFWTSGYGIDPKAVLKTLDGETERVDELVFQAGLPFYSHCEHHLAPFFGVAHVAYVPNGRIVGLSKLGRLVDIFSRRLSVQERMTAQIADALMENLKPLGSGVVIQARHLCMESRGIQKTGTITVTSALRGVIKDKPEARAEFMSLITSAIQEVRSL